MVEIVGVRFKKAGKTYYFAPGNLELKSGENVIVETARGIEFGEIAIPNKEINESCISAPLKPVVCRATEADKKQVEENKIKEKRLSRYLTKKLHGTDLI